MEKTKIVKSLITGVLVLLTVAVLAAAPAAAADTVASSVDWENFVIKQGDSHGDVDIILSADITLDNALVAEDKYLKNVKINGNGHKITLKMNETAADNVALIGCVENGNVEISDLTVEGAVVMKDLAGKNRAAAIIAYAKGGNYSFTNVNIEGMKIVSGGSVGGFIGYATKDAVISINSCTVNKSLIKASANYYSGGFIGCVEDGCDITILKSALTNSWVRAEKVAAGGFVGCAAGKLLNVHGCTVADSEIYGAFGQTGGIVGFLNSDLNVDYVGIYNSTILTTAAPALTAGASYRSAETVKFIGVGGLVGEKNGDQFTLTATETSIESTTIASNREIVNYIVGYPNLGTMNGVSVSADTKLMPEISAELNPDLYEGKTVPTVVSTPFPLVGILAGLGIAGLLFARKRKTE